MAFDSFLSISSTSSTHSPPFDSLINDASTDVHLQSYPGERLPRESYVQLSSDPTSELNERDNRGSSVLAGISVVTNTIIGVALLGVPW